MDEFPFVRHPSFGRRKCSSFLNREFIQRADEAQTTYQGKRRKARTEGTVDTKGSLLLCFVI